MIYKYRKLAAVTSAKLAEQMTSTPYGDENEVSHQYDIVSGVSETFASAANKAINIPVTPENIPLENIEIVSPTSLSGILEGEVLENLFAINTNY